MTAIPTIDLRRTEPEAGDRIAALRELRETLGTVGAFYLVGHGVQAAGGDELLAAARRFFALPIAERRSIAMANSAHFRGYTAAGNELTAGRPDWREEIDIGAERAVRDEPGAPPYWRLQGPNQWPAAQPDLRHIALGWIERMRAVAARTARAVAEALELPRDFFDAAFEPDPHLLLKLVRYPGRGETGDRQGVGAHKDAGFLTLVLQDVRGGSGLQFRAGDRWIDVAPRPGAFVVNLGEALELATGHRLRATLHRVVSPPPDRDYVSAPFFYNPRFDFVIEPVAFPAHVLPPPDGAIIDPTNPIFAEYGYNALKGRLRSHRDVAERFYADVSPLAPT